MKTGFIGAGKVGCSLGKLFSTRGMKVTGYYDHDTEAACDAATFTESRVFATPQQLISESDVLFMTVPDGLISQVFTEIMHDPIQGKYICHCSGSISSRDAFPGVEGTGAYEYSVHPLFAVSDRYETYRELADAFFTLEGNADHLDEMAAFLQEAGLKFQIIPPQTKTRYHLAAVYASNLILGLIGQAGQLLQECGFTEEDALQAIAPLVTGNVQHALNKGPVQALTGPVERGDAGTIRRHLSVCETPEERALYRMLSAQLLPLARRKHPQRDYTELEDLLSDR